MRILTSLYTPVHLHVRTDTHKACLVASHIIPRLYVLFCGVGDRKGLTDAKLACYRRAPAIIPQCPVLFCQSRFSNSRLALLRGGGCIQLPSQVSLENTAIIPAPRGFSIVRAQPYTITPNFCAE